MANPRLPQRKRPVHMVPVERDNKPVIVLVTLCSRPRVPEFANSTFHAAFLKAARDADTWSIGYYVIMPDHIHVFCRPAIIPRVSVKRWASFLKRRVSCRLGPRDWKWQADCWDRQMRSRTHYQDRFAYVRMNPVRQGLVDRGEAWPYQGSLNVLSW